MVSVVIEDTILIVSRDFSRGGFDVVIIRVEKQSVGGVPWDRSPSGTFQYVKTIKSVVQD